MKLDTVRGRIDLLAHLGPDQLEFLESVCTPMSYAAGDVVFEEDAPAKEFSIIVSGKVGLELAGPGRAPMVIQTLGTGDLLGLSWMYPPYRWNWRARARVETRTLSFDAAAVRVRCDQDSDFGRQVLGAVARQAIRRLHHTRTRLTDLYLLQP